MIKKYIFYCFNNLSIEDILDDVIKNHKVIIVTQTEKLDFDRITHQYLKKIELEKMHRYAKKIDRLNYLITHSIVNLFFSNVLSCSIENINYIESEYGKPYIENNKKIKFNISHSGGCAIVALSKHDIGVDIEFINKKFSFNDIINISFSRSEINFIKNDVNKFYKYWVSKEAYLKYEGTGLFKDIRDIEVLFCNDKNVLLQDKQKNMLVQIEIDKVFENYILGICFS